MTINELYNIWYDGNKNDINFINACYNMLKSVSIYTIDDQRQYRQLKEGIQYALEDWLYDNQQ